MCSRRKPFAAMDAAWFMLVDVGIVTEEFTPQSTYSFLPTSCAEFIRGWSPDITT